MNMLPWPEKPKINSSMNGEEYERYMHIGWHEYERARAEAALQRLRVAVEALKNASAGYENYGFTGVRKALEQIGEVPPA